MAKKQQNSIKEKSQEVLQKDVAEARKELFSLTVDNQMRKLKNTRSIFMKRKEIARMLTAIRALDMQSVRNAQDKKEVANG